MTLNDEIGRPILAGAYVQAWVWVAFDATAADAITDRAIRLAAYELYNRDGEIEIEVDAAPVSRHYE